MQMTCALARFLPLLLTAVAALAQSGAESGSIAGSVLDVSGKPIPAAVVSVKNESTGAPRAVVAAQEGKFSLAGLPAGPYTVEASAPSFASSRRNGVKVAAKDTATVSLSLNVGELAQSITVEGAVSVAAETAPSQNT